MPEPNSEAPKKEWPILVMAGVTLLLIVIMAGVSVMSLYTALYPPDFEERARQIEAERAEQQSGEQAVPGSETEADNQPAGSEQSNSDQDEPSSGASN